MSTKPVRKAHHKASPRLAVKLGKSSAGICARVTGSSRFCGLASLFQRVSSTCAWAARSWLSVCCMRASITVPIRLTAKALPKVRNSMIVEVATPMRCGATALCAATRVVRLAMPMP